MSVEPTQEVEHTKMPASDSRKSNKPRSRHAGRFDETKGADEQITHLSDKSISEQLEHSDSCTVRLKEQKSLNEVERQLTEGVALFW